ncbi:MAG: hypothetical protein HRU46_07775 [Verrucomicrobiales bacterium]|nr:hypothetical protein [Verrucomicrobiales bacterium]
MLNTFGESGDDVSRGTNAEVLRQHLGEVPLFESVEEMIDVRNLAFSLLD